jgi:hypothetical protein
MRRRAKITRDATGSWRVDLPTYVMVPGTWRPIIPAKTTADGVLPATDPADPALNALTVEIECPDDYVDPSTGKIDRDRIRAKYKGNPKWDRPDWTPPD